MNGHPVLEVEEAGHVVDAVLPGGLGVPQLDEVDLELGAVVVNLLELLQNSPVGKVKSIYRDSWVNGAMDNGSNCLLVQNVAGTERIGLSHSKVAWLMVQEILDNGSILFLFSTSKLYIFSH